MGEKRYLSVVLIGLSLLMSEAEHFFLWLSHLHFFYSANSVCLSHFSIGLLMYLLSILGTLYIYWSNNVISLI